MDKEQMEKELDRLIEEAKKMHEDKSLHTENGKDKCLSSQAMKDMAAKELLKANSYVLITLSEDGACTSMHGDFTHDLATAFALHDLMSDKSSFYEKATIIKDCIRKAIRLYENAKNDPMFQIIKSLSHKQNDKKTGN